MRSAAAVGVACLSLLLFEQSEPVLSLSSARVQRGSVAPAWRSLAAGIDYATVRLLEAPAIGDGLLHVVRIDPFPRGAVFDVGLASLEGTSRTAGAWADRKGFVAVINAGMFQMDGVSNVGFLRRGQHANNPRWNAYQSVLALHNPETTIDKWVPDAVILDRDADGFDAQSARYRTLVQNLRLIKAPGVNVWQKNARRWSEAAIAMTRQGQILFLFSRTPHEMFDFNRRLLALPLDIVSAMHVEGGPEASLSIRAPGLRLDLAGSFETAFRENDGNAGQWALPNVIGVRANR